MTSSARSGGRSADGPAPRARSLLERLDDPDEPLYTVGVAGDLLGIDSQTLRRLEGAISQTSARPSGNQRRYSRNDLEGLEAAIHLTNQGYAPAAMARILELERQVAALPRPPD